jgi:hypothetical protein
MLAVIWLLLIVETGPPVHVGNFPDLPSCQDAASKHVVVGKPGIGDPATFICVQANRGQQNDPEPPH